MSALAELIIAVVVGWCVGTVLWRGGRRIFEAYVFQRHNYRDHSLPTAVGILLPLALAVVVGVHVAVFSVWRALFGPASTGWTEIAEIGPTAVSLAVVFGLLGLLDDLGGVGESGGFRGHLKALFGGRITTGLVKMAGGPLMTLAVLAGAGAPAGRLGHLRDAAVISLAANLANLFDRAPGRVNKVGQAAFVVLALATLDVGLVPVAVVVGAALALLGPDLREVIMLGDSGSNVIGALLGFGVVVSTTVTQRWIVLVVLLALNLSSELVSFSRVIDAVPPLRRLDRLGSPYRRG